MTGLDLIRDERIRQIDDLGWTAEHDDSHIHGELAMVAACYAAGSAGEGIFVAEVRGKASITIDDAFPWHMDDDARFKDLDGEVTLPRSPDVRYAVDQRIRLLAKAGALAAAEIDRLERMKVEMPKL